MKFLNNLILISLTTIILSANFVLAQTQKAGDIEYENSKVIPVVDFSKNLKIKIPENQNKKEKNNVKKENKKSWFKLKKKPLNVSDETKKKFNLTDESNETINAIAIKVEDNNQEQSQNNAGKKKKSWFKRKEKPLKVSDETKKKFNLTDESNETINATAIKVEDNNQEQEQNQNNAAKKKKSWFFNKKNEKKKNKKEDSSVDITSERMDYDPKTQNIIASGNARVYFAKEDATLYANKIVFDTEHNKITAKGKVRMIKDGKWVYGDYIIIDMNFGSSLIENPITKDDKITLNAQYGTLTEDKIKGFWGNIRFNDKQAIALQTRTFGRYFPLEQEFQQDMVNKDDKSLSNNSFTLKARTIIVDRFKDHDTAKLKKASIYRNGEHLTGIGDIELITNKEQNFVELSGPELGSENQLGMFLGYGFVFKMPYGSTLKVAPIITQKSEFGLGFISRFLSKRNHVEFGYGTSRDKIILDGKYKINGDWSFDYGINAYKDDGFMGARMPELIGELRYKKNYDVPELSARFSHELKAGIARDYNWDESSDRNFSTFRAKWQAELYKELFTYIYSDDIDIQLGLIGQTSLGVYGTGDTQAVVRFAPTLSHRFKRWHSRVSYYISGSKDDSPFEFDKYRYGRSALEFTQSLAICKYLSIAYRGVYVLDGETYDNTKMQENRFYISVGPPNAKFSIGYDYVRKNTYFDMSMLLGSEKSGVDFEYLEMNDIEKQKKNKKFKWFKRKKSKNQGEIL